MRGCERGTTVERSETGERTRFAPAGQTTARAGQLCWLTALVVRRQAVDAPRRGQDFSLRMNRERDAAVGRGPGMPGPYGCTNIKRRCYLSDSNAFYFI